MSIRIVASDEFGWAREDHREWMAAASPRDRLMYLFYTGRYGMNCDHLSSTAQDRCYRDADALIAMLTP